MERQRRCENETSAYPHELWMSHEPHVWDEAFQNKQAGPLTNPESAPVSLKHTPHKTQNQPVIKSQDQFTNLQGIFHSSFLS